MEIHINLGAAFVQYVGYSRILLQANRLTVGCRQVCRFPVLALSGHGFLIDIAVVGDQGFQCYQNATIVGFLGIFIAPGFGLFQRQS